MGKAIMFHIPAPSLPGHHLPLLSLQKPPCMWETCRVGCCFRHVLHWFCTTRPRGDRSRRLRERTCCEAPGEQQHAVHPRGTDRWWDRPNVPERGGRSAWGGSAGVFSCPKDPWSLLDIGVEPSITRVCTLKTLVFEGADP